MYIACVGNNRGIRQHRIRYNLSLIAPIRGVAKIDTVIGEVSRLVKARGSQGSCELCKPPFWVYNIHIWFQLNAVFFG